MPVFFMLMFLVGTAAWYWLSYFDALHSGEMVTTPEERTLALGVLIAMLIVGALLWPRTRHSIPLLDFMIPGTMFCIGWLGILLLAYHCRTGVRMAERYGISPPESCSRAQVAGAAGGIAGIVYVLAYRWYPPPMPPADPPDGWRRYIQHTLLNDIVEIVERFT